LTTFLALGAIVGVDLGTSPKDPRKRSKQQKLQNQRQAKQCINKDWDYPSRGGRLTQIVNHLGKLCKGYIDKPTYQCRCLQRQRTLFWSLMKSRRVCLGRKRQHDRQQAKKEENKSRKRRDDDEEDHTADINDFDENNVLDANAAENLNAETDLADALENGADLSDDDMDDLLDSTCPADLSELDTEEDAEYAKEECEQLRQAADDLHNSAGDEETKERAEIMYRIIRMHRAMGNWADTYIADGSFCDKRSKMKKRIVKNRRRMQRKRRAYPTNPLKLKKKKQDQRKKEQAKKEKEEEKAAANQ
jgi:hypothetical protein